MIRTSESKGALRVPHSLRAFCAKGGKLLVLATLASPAAIPQQTAPASNLAQTLVAGKTRIVDLTHPLAEKYPAWPGDAKPFEAAMNATIAKHGYFTRRVSFLEHFGTHLDAPAHFVEGQPTVEKIPAERLFALAVILDVRAEAAKDADYQLAAAKIEAWEKKNGRIPAGAIVLLRTGWARRWPDQTRYRNADPSGAMHFPGFSVEATKLLLARRVAALGIDALSVDYGASKDFAVHKLSHSAGLYHLENLADLSALPESGAFLIVAPIKLEGGSGGPARVFALLL